MPIQLVNAGGMRALDAVHRLGSLPNYRRTTRYSGFGMKPLGSSLGARYEVVARVDSVIAAHR
jgi:hypothetical protein